MFFSGYNALDLRFIIQFPTLNNIPNFEHISTSLICNFTGLLYRNLKKYNNLNIFSNFYRILNRNFPTPTFSSHCHKFSEQPSHSYSSIIMYSTFTRKCRVAIKKSWKWCSAPGLMSPVNVLPCPVNGLSGHLNTIKKLTVTCPKGGILYT